MKAIKRHPAVTGAAIIGLVIVGLVVTLAAIHEDPKGVTPSIEHAEERSEAAMATSQRHAVIATLRRYASAYSSHDVQTLLTLFSGEIERTSNATGSCVTTTGTQAVLAVYKQQFAAGAGRYKLEDASSPVIEPGAEDEATVRARYRITPPGSAGPIQFMLDRLPGEGWHITQLGVGCPATPTSASRLAGTTKLTKGQWEALGEAAFVADGVWLGDEIIAGPENARSTIASVENVCAGAQAGACVSALASELSKRSTEAATEAEALSRDVSGTCVSDLREIARFGSAYHALWSAVGGGHYALADAAFGLSLVKLDGELIESRVFAPNGVTEATAAHSAHGWSAVPDALFSTGVAACKP